MMRTAIFLLVVLFTVQLVYVNATWTNFLTRRRTSWHWNQKPVQLNQNVTETMDAPLTNVTDATEAPLMNVTDATDAPLTNVTSTVAPLTNVTSTNATLAISTSPLFLEGTLSNDTLRNGSFRNEPFLPELGIMQ
ncbi:uncharacterized protein LOC100186641 [Ciona intestinalis]